MAFCLAGAIFGLVGLAGWLTPAKTLTTVIPGQPVMMPNTAISLVLLGIAAVMRGQRSGMLRTLLLLPAMVAFMIGAGTLYEYMSGMNGLDQFFIPCHLGPYPGRPSPPTALAITLLAFAIPYLDLRSERRIRLPEWLVLGALLIALISMLGQLFGAGPLYRFMHAPIHGVAVPTAVGLFAISMGLLLEQPNTGVMRIVTGPGPGSVLIRQLGPWAILAPAAVGVAASWLVQRPGIVDIPLVFAALTILLALVSLLLLALTAVRLDRADEALERSRMRTREVIDHASDGIFLADLNGVFVDVNEAGCRMLRCARDEIIGKMIVEFVPENEAERVWTAREHVLRGETYVVEHSFCRKDGTLVPVEVSTKLLPDGRWQGFVRDISERKRAEEALRISEAKFSGIVSISADAVISVDGSQHITLFNDSAERMFGRTRADTIGAPLDILIPERLRGAHGRHFERFMQGPNTARTMGNATTHIVGVRSNGEEFPADTAISKISVVGETILTATVRDVTEQRRLEHEKTVVEELVSALGATLDFDEVLTIVTETLVSEFADVCIVDIEEEGQSRRARVTSRDPYLSWVSEALKHVEEQGERVTEPLLFKNVTPEQLARWLPGPLSLKALRTIAPNSAMVMPLVAGEKCVGQIFILSNNPARRYSARDMSLASSLVMRGGRGLHRTILYRTAVRATQARDAVLGIVAHDLRNPLQLIMLRAAEVRKLPVPGSEALGETIAGATMRMNHLIQDILDVGQLESGHFSLRSRRIVPNDIISDAVEAQLPLASQASLELRVDVPLYLPEIWGDQDRLMQIFENLIGNAIKFTKAGGCITLGAEANSGEVVFSVRDTGTGIAEENVQHIFDRFWQAAAGRRRGAGLGLPIVKGLVEAHGGRVWVSSVPGKGTTVYFSIPLAGATGEQVSAAG